MYVLMVLDIRKLILFMKKNLEYMMFILTVIQNILAKPNENKKVHLKYNQKEKSAIVKNFFSQIILFQTQKYHKCSKF